MDAELRVLICQLNSIDDLDSNLKQIHKLIDQIPISEKIDLICLPENSLYMRVKEGAQIPGLNLNSKAFHSLEEISKQRNSFVHIGSIPLESEGRLVNASVLIEPGVARRKSYEKIHLFDIELDGSAPIRETDMFHHGKSPAVVTVRGWKIGQTICYDLRFAELFLEYAKSGADLVLVPSAFLVETGKAHWEVLLRARAIESQCYIVAAAQAGKHVGCQGGQRMTYGHSLAIDPWGTVIWQGSSDGAECKLVILQKSEISKVRRQIPMKNHRRLLSVFLGFLTVMTLKVQKANSSESPLMSAKEKEIQMKVKKKLFPGGRDEESLKVQVQLPQSIRKIVPDSIDSSNNGDDSTAEPSADD